LYTSPAPMVITTSPSCIFSAKYISISLKLSKARA